MLDAMVDLKSQGLRLQNAILRNNPQLTTFYSLLYIYILRLECLKNREILYDSFSFILIFFYEDFLTDVLFELMFL